MAKYPHFPPQPKECMSAKTKPQPGTAVPQAAPYQDRSIEVGGLKLHYQDYGTAGKTPMVCVHGGAASGHWFDFVAPDFRAAAHVNTCGTCSYRLFVHDPQRNREQQESDRPSPIADRLE